MPPAAAPPPAPPAPAPAVPPGAPPAAPKVSNPFDDSFKDMERFTDPDPNEPPTPQPAAPPKAPAKGAPAKSVKPAAPAKPAPAAPPEPPDPDEDQDPDQITPAGEPKPGEEQGKAGEGKPGRESPWRLVETYKKNNAALQREIAELRTAQKPGELPKEAQARFSSLEARNKELEDEIRHVNYTKSKDYIDNYQRPYEEAWTRAISEIKELRINNEDGTSRAASVQDMLALANMPAQEAWDKAEAWFGKAASEVMAHRRALRELSDKQQRALEDARKNGSEREQQLNLERQSKAKAQAEETSRIWSSIVEDAVNKYEFLRPVEGQTERNDRLEKAAKFVDETFALNVNQAKTEQERQDIIKRHAALRNRAIGFSVLKHENRSLRAELESLKQQLAEFQGSEPTAGERRHAAANGNLDADTLEGAIAGVARLAE